MTIGAQQIWETSLGQLQLQMSRSSYDTWLKGTVGLELEGDLLTVGAPTPFAAEWLERRMHQLIERAVTDVAASPLHVRYQILVQQQHARANGPSLTTLGAPLLGDTPHLPSINGTPANGTFNHRYTFQSFVVGVSNQLAYAAATAVAQQPGDQYNPLFIYSGVGLGKTHLLHAIASAVAQSNLHPIYVTTEQFTNAFIQAIRERKTESFRAKYRSADVLLLDDIQFLAGKEQTQEGFFHTFNDLHNSNRQIVVACDQPPRTLSLLDDRLRSRFEWGLIADIQPPDLETRLAILHNRAHVLGAKLSDGIAEAVARHAYHSVRELEGCLNRIVALAHFLNTAISSDLVTMALADLVVAPPVEQVDPAAVIAQVAAYYQLSPEALCTRTRDRKTTHPQRLTMYILGKTLNQHLTDIGELLGQWHSRTVRNSIQQVANQLTTELPIENDLCKILSALGIASP